MVIEYNWRSKKHKNSFNNENHFYYEIFTEISKLDICINELGSWIFVCLFGFLQMWSPHKGDRNLFGTSERAHRKC